MIDSLPHPDLIAEPRIEWVQQSSTVPSHLLVQEGEEQAIDLRHYERMCQTGTYAAAPKVKPHFTVAGMDALAELGLLGVQTRPFEVEREPLTNPVYFESDDLPSRLLTWLQPGSSNASAPVLAFWYDALGTDQVAVPQTDNMVSANEIISQLGQLQDGWSGASSFAPADSVKRDIYEALAAIGGFVREPEVEVDDDGSVALLWPTADIDFAMTFLGNGKVYGTASPQTLDFLPWSVDIASGELPIRLASSRVSQLIL
jgi:hypothetical protein